MRTFTPKPADITREWHVIDADGLVLGRMSTEVARLLRGKHRPYFAPHVDTGDFVIIVNADKIALSSDKADKKFAYRHSGYPGVSVPRVGATSSRTTRSSLSSTR